MIVCIPPRNDRALTNINIHIFLRLCCICLLGHFNLILLWVVFKIYSSNMYHFIASHNLHSSQVCLIPVLITVLITAVHYSSPHNIYAYSMSSCMHCSVMTVDTEYPLQGMLEVDTLPLVNVCTHRIPVEYGMAWWLSASCSSLWHSHGFLPAMENWYFDVKMLLLHELPCLNEAVNTDIYAWNTCVLLHRYPYVTEMLPLHGTCFHSYILHFVSYHTVGHKLVAMTYGRPMCMHVCK